jgi:hypothetical protein
VWGGERGLEAEVAVHGSGVWGMAVGYWVLWLEGVVKADVLLGTISMALDWGGSAEVRVGFAGESEKIGLRGL